MNKLLRVSLGPPGAGIPGARLMLLFTPVSIAEQMNAEGVAAGKVPPLTESRIHQV
jgi:hypothetical protein